ncbi:MAG: pre-mRNA 3-end-processing factor fip1l1 [Marteilia pararefringens]
MKKVLKFFLNAARPMIHRLNLSEKMALMKSTMKNQTLIHLNLRLSKSNKTFNIPMCISLIVTRIRTINQITTQQNLITNNTAAKPDGSNIPNNNIDFSNLFNPETFGNVNIKSVAELDLDTLAEKPWNDPGADVTDYFNYGFTEPTWRAYCRKQQIIRTLLVTNPNLLMAPEGSQGQIIPNMTNAQIPNLMMPNIGNNNIMRNQSNINAINRTQFPMTIDNNTNNFQMQSHYLPSMPTNQMVMDFKNFPLQKSIIGYSVFCNLFDNYIPPPLTANEPKFANNRNYDSTCGSVDNNQQCFWPIFLEQFNIFEFIGSEMATVGDSLSDEFPGTLNSNTFNPSLYIKPLNTGCKGIELNNTNSKNDLSASQNSCADDSKLDQQSRFQNAEENFKTKIDTDNSHSSSNLDRDLDWQDSTSESNNQEKTSRKRVINKEDDDNSESDSSSRPAKRGPWSNNNRDDRKSNRSPSPDISPRNKRSKISGNIKISDDNIKEESSSSKQRKDQKNASGERSSRKQRGDGESLSSNRSHSDRTHSRRRRSRSREYKDDIKKQSRH